MKCKIKDLSINYEILGEGKPILMLHGYSVDHRVMAGCMETVSELEKNYKRIYMDLPGMGESGSAEWIVNADRMLEIIIEFIEKLIPGENFLLAGESYGGYLARGVINKMADRVDGVLLICPVIIADHKKRNVPGQVILVKDEALISELPPEEAENFNSMAVVQSETIYKRFKNEIMSGIEIADETFLSHFQETGYEFSFDVDKANGKYNKPSLIILGKQDSCVGYKDAWGILENFPRATFAVLDRAGHNLQIEQEELFAALVNEWCTRLLNS